jgi:hypothetical protein
MAPREVADGELDWSWGRAAKLNLERDRQPGTRTRRKDVIGLDESVRESAAGCPLLRDLREPGHREHGSDRLERERRRGLVRYLHAQLKLPPDLRRARAGVLSERWRVRERERRGGH